MTETPPHPPSAEERFARRLLDLATGGMLTHLIALGAATGLFQAAARGPATGGELAARAGLHERYVQEWLAAMAAAGIFEYEAEAERYTLPPAHAALLTGDGSENLTVLASAVAHASYHLPGLAGAFRSGGGVPWSAFRAEYAGAVAAMSDRRFADHLLQGMLPAVEGLTARLEAGAAVLDVGSRSGTALRLMAARFPASRFEGIDVSETAVQEASAAAQREGLANLRFAVADVLDWLGERRYDVVTAFDVVHELPAPEETLRRIRDALAPGGRFLMLENRFASGLAGNLADPLAPLYYGFSVMHCVPLALDAGGPAYGTLWGEQRARAALEAAGFAEVTVHPVANGQHNLFACAP